MLQTTLLFYLQSRLKEAVQLLEDYKHGTLPPGVTNKEVRGKSLLLNFYFFLQSKGGGNEVAF